MHRTTQRKDPLILYETVNVFSKHVFSKLVVMLEFLHLRDKAVQCVVLCCLGVMFREDPMTPYD